ncbi:MAG: hypothetical protein HQK84_05965, partial [Nitrospinae bacterium]|nr:hypothetical protein [Nitrospinota bacterium]
MLRQPENTRTKHVILFVIISIFTIFVYSKQFGIWYWGDDYLTVAAGGTGGILEKSAVTIDWLHVAQNRFQPVRLFFATLVEDLVEEEHSFYFSLLLHLLNIALLYRLLLRFRVPLTYMYPIVILFSVYGVNRYIEGVHVSFGGALFNSFLILSTLLSLLHGLEAKDGRKKVTFILLSYIPFYGLAFSYEVAFPLIVTVFFVFYVFNFLNQSKSIKEHWKELFYLVPYVIALLLYLVTKGMSISSGYEGAQVDIGLNILIRFKSYVSVLLDSLFIYESDDWGGILASLVIYYVGAFILLKKHNEQEYPFWKFRTIREYLTFFIFSLIFFL